MYMCIFMLIDGHLPLGMYVYLCYYVESFMECALDKLYITENVSFLLSFFLTSIHVHHYICNSCWNLQIEIKSPVWFFPLNLLLDRFITGTTCAVFSLYNTCTSFILINLESNNFWVHSCEYRASKYKKTKQQYSWKHLFSCTCIYTKQHTHVYALMLTIN